MATGPVPLEFDVTPSASHAFEPELTGMPPRPVPDALGEGPYARRRRAAIVALAVAGAFCLALSRAPGVDVLARYLLPLGYLLWIGVAALLLAGVLYVELSLRRGPFRYVSEGLPLAVRVVDLIKTPTAIVNGTPSTHAFVAAVVFRHPESGELAQAQVKSNDFSSARKDAYDTPFKVADTVTAVYLPGRLEKTLRLYAFLDLSPDVNLTPRGRPRATDSPWKLAAMLAAIPVIFLALFANVYAFGRYQPLDFSFHQTRVPMIAGGLLLGGALFASLYLSHRAEQRELQRRAAAAHATGAAVERGAPFLGGGLHGWFLRVVMVAGAPLIGGLTAVCWCFMANAWLDRSVAVPAPATVTNMVMKTHVLMFREYELEYVLDGSSKKHTMMTTPEHLTSFTTPQGVAWLREGRLGWRWVQTVTPVETPVESP
jgi:hypothetical protein